MRLCLSCLCLLSTTIAAPAFGQQAETPAVSDPREIVVTGERQDEKEQVVDLSRAITRRTRTGKPVARHFSPVCVGVIGMKQDAAFELIGRIEAHATAFGIGVQGEGCRPNVVVGFGRDTKGEIEDLRKNQSWLFTDMMDAEIARIYRGNGAAQAWHVTAEASVDGRPQQGVTSGGSAASGPAEYSLNRTLTSSRLQGTTRTQIEASIVLFDTDFVLGKSVRQLADYATMRLFADTDDASGDAGSRTDTILALFADGGSPPNELTAFDRAYLDGLYALPPSASAAQLNDAAWDIYRTETEAGQ